LDFDITVEVNFAPLTCSSGSATLGYAEPNRVLKIDNVWYGTAQANKINQSDTSGTFNDIYANFNSSIDTGCYSGSPDGWYYGLDNIEPANKEMLLDVVLHEIGHGLGFLSFVDGDTGALFNAAIDAYSQNLIDTVYAKTWETMTDAERLDSNNNDNLIWNGSLANAAANTGGSNPLTAGFENGGIKIHAPSSYNSGSSIGHISTEAIHNQLMEPYNTDDGIHPSLEILMFKDMGYKLKTDLTGKNIPIAENYTLDIAVNGTVNLDITNHLTDGNAE
jgi:hypothetical protein